VSIATAGTTIMRKWPRQRLLVALLAVSVVLNLFFIAGFFVAGAPWSHLNRAVPAGGVEQRFHEMATQLALDPQQQLAFDRYEAAVQSARENLRRKIGPVFEAVQQEIAQPQPDVTRIRQLLDEAAETRRGFQQEAVMQTVKFVATLSAEQREKFVAIERERRPQHH
jgi:Spy/CpxP family protein refolding chaperone